MGWNRLLSLFNKKRRGGNRALAELLQHRRDFDARMEESVAALPRLADLLLEGRDYLYEKVILAAADDYDVRAQSGIAKQIDPTKEQALRDELAAIMLFAFHEEYAQLDPQRPEWAMGLTRALHGEMATRARRPVCSPFESGAMTYLSYRNPHFEDPKVAYAFRFGQRIAQIMETLDTPFSLMMAQQAKVCTDIARRLTRWGLFDEPIAPEATPSGASPVAGTDLP
jgi:hypothetical protein